MPTRDRPGPLSRCLDALAAQDLGDLADLEALEVVVVDDGSVDDGAVRAAAAGRARVLRRAGPSRGPAAARNDGIRIAEADVVLLTDDDCRPEPGWAVALVARIEAGATVAAGPTLVSADAGAPARAAQVITNHLVASSTDGGTVGFAPTSNLAARAETLVALAFDEKYPLAAGEDRDWCDRLTSTGTDIAFVPAAVVRHHPDLSVRRFWRQQVRYGRGARRFRAAPSGATTRARPGSRFYVDLLRAGFREGASVGALVGAAQAAAAVGVAVETRAERARRRR